MTHLFLADEVWDDFQRIFDHLIFYNVENPSDRMDEIIHAFDVLKHNPEIGRLDENNLRELVIGRGSHGYLAQYRYQKIIDTAFILAIRSQREDAYGAHH